MWPSNTEVRNTLSQTGVLLFRDGNLQLNSKLDLAKTLLEKELLISTIDTINAIFDQKEKLKLAILLRDYIYSCKNLEQIQLDSQHFWKDYYQFLKHYILEIPLLTVLAALLSPLIIPLKWLGLKFSFWSASKEQIKNKERLTLSVQEAVNPNHSINPLTIDYDPKLFEIPEKKEIFEAPNLSVEQLIENLADITRIFSKKFETHIGADSTYELKHLLKDGLQRIYYRLNGNFDQILGPLQEKAAFIHKLYEGINNCSEGFHDRVNTLLESFNPVENFTELLYLVRKSLIEKTAIAQMHYYNFFRNTGNEIHTYHDFTRIAHQEGLGVPLETDSYRGEMSWEGIRKALHTEFENHYTLFNLPTLLTDILQGLLLKVGYTGAKPIHSSYTVGTEESEVEKITQLIKKFLSSDIKNTHWKDFFIIHDETYNIIDVNWEFIRTLFLKQLTSENYFKICSNEDFNQHLLNLLNDIKNTNNNYFTLLAQIQPKSFHILFHRLEKAKSKELQEKIIALFFEKDETGLSPLQLISRNDSDILTRFFYFIDSDPCHQKIIQALLIKHSHMIWDNFDNISKNQPKSAFIFLNYINQHPEMFKPDSENLSKIQHGLSNLMSKRSSDIIQESALLHFLSSFPNALPQPSKTMIDFLFNSLSHLDDKQLINDLISQYSGLLLKNFSVDYFKKQSKNLVPIIEKLLDVYHQELIHRKNTHVEYTTQFFNYSFGYSTSQKLTALAVLKNILNNDSNIEKIEQLHKAKSAFPALRNGRLSHLFKACTQDIAITSHLKIQSQI